MQHDELLSNLVEGRMVGRPTRGRRRHGEKASERKCQKPAVQQITEEEAEIPVWSLLFFMVVLVCGVLSQPSLVTVTCYLSRHWLLLLFVIVNVLVFVAVRRLVDNQISQLEGP